MFWHIDFYISYMLLVHLQIKYSPRRVPGFGLTDGEVLERIWSFLRRFGKMTKEMRPNHRVDVLSDALLFYAKKKSGRIGEFFVVVYTFFVKLHKHFFSSVMS